MYRKIHFQTTFSFFHKALTRIVNNQLTLLLGVCVPLPQVSIQQDLCAYGVGASHQATHRLVESHL